MNVYCYNDETDYYENLSEFLADKKRFPEKFLIAVAENVGKVKNGEISKERFNDWFFMKIDFYDNIKASERWWDGTAEEYWHNRNPHIFDIDSVELKNSYPNGIPNRR